MKIKKILWIHKYIHERDKNRTFDRAKISVLVTLFKLFFYGVPYRP